jgi:hypothetical protein
LRHCCQAKRAAKGGRQDNRRFVETVLWLAHSDCRWQALFIEWGTGIPPIPGSSAWPIMLCDALHMLLPDSATVRAHQHAGGAR